MYSLYAIIILLTEIMHMEHPRRLSNVCCVLNNYCMSAYVTNGPALWFQIDWITKISKQSENNGAHMTNIWSDMLLYRPETNPNRIMACQAALVKAVPATPAVIIIPPISCIFLSRNFLFRRFAGSAKVRQTLEYYTKITYFHLTSWKQFQAHERGSLLFTVPSPTK